MNTQEILQIALDTAGLAECPADSGVILEGDNLKKVVFGVDMEAAELLIAKQIEADAVITHHPKGGSTMVNFFKVMENQIERMVAAGVPINKAQKVLRERMDQVERGNHVGNYDRVVSAAKVLGMPFVGIHTPADLMAETIVQTHLDMVLSGKPKAKVQDVINALMEIPEYEKTLAQPAVRVGSSESYAGKVWVTMAGGTSGGVEVAKAYFDAGVGTLVVMHMPEDAIKAVKAQNIGNVVVAGHMASDSVGINAIIGELEAKGLEVVRMAGVIEP